MMDFGDRIALVTGASRGLGFAVAQALGAAGAQVIALARTVGGLEDLDEAIRAAGGSPATLVPLDITDDAGLERMGAALHERWGRLDIWLHTAISAPPLAPVEHADAKDLDKAIAINIRASQRLIRVLDPLLRQSAVGRVVTFEDPAGESDGFHGVYRATKTAQSALFSDWARGVKRTTSIRLVRATPPPMPTALRLRFHPGEDTSGLARPADVAARLVDHLRLDTVEDVRL